MTLLQIIRITVDSKAKTASAAVSADVFGTTDSQLSAQELRYCPDGPSDCHGLLRSKQQFPGEGPLKNNSRSIPPHWSDRRRLLVETRNLKMASSAHAYVRGSTLKFYEWLDSLAPQSLPVGPAIWICGDCHVGNLGPIANAKGKVEIQIRDFDQTIIGNPAHDLIRLGLSLAMAARGSDLPGVTTAMMLEHMVDGYAEEFVAHRRFLPAEKPEAVYDALKKSQGRSWRHLARDRMGGHTAILPLGRRFWPVSKAERSAIRQLFESGAMTRLATRLGHRTDDSQVELVDASYWLKGCSSLGLLRYAALLDIEGQARKGQDLCLIDIKEAAAPLAPPIDGAVMPTDQAERVLLGATQMSPHLGERMAASRLLGKSVFLRELLPEDLKLKLDRVSTEQATRSARYLARVVGRAHARQMSEADKKRWRTELTRNYSKTLDAPSWLWSSVVELISVHERAYLDHCRRYAMQAVKEPVKLRPPLPAASPYR